MVGNDANLDILQLVCRLVGATEVSNILAKYPQWDRAPRRLKLPALSRESREIPDSADHIKPTSWKGNVKVKDVSLQTSWNRGRRLVEDDCSFIKAVLIELEGTPGVDLLAPFGVLLFDVPLAEDDIDESLECPILDSIPSNPSPQTLNITSGRNNSQHIEESEARVEVEDRLDELVSSENVSSESTAPIQRQIGAVFSSKVLINGVKMAKSRALARYSKFRKHASSTDRLRRVQDVKRYVKNNSLDKHIGGGSYSNTPTDETEVLVISDPITTLLYSEKRFWICVGEVNDIKIDGDFADSVSVEMLDEDTVTISCQMLGLRPATSDDDPDQKHDWRTYTIKERSFTVPGRLIQVVNPSLSKTHTTICFRAQFLLHLLRASSKV